MTTLDFRSILASHGDLLARGSHRDDDPATCPLCVLELAGLARFGRVTDEPCAVGYPDIRAINDSYLDDQRRTDALLPWLDALAPWADWSDEQRVRWARIVAMRTVREVLPIALRAIGLDEHADRCAQAEDLAANAAYAARAAANAAYAANVAEAAEAANAAARAARAAADRDARHDVLDLAVRIQIEAAQEVEKGE